MALLGNLKGSAQVFQDTEFYNGVATQSLRFDDGSSAKLEKTPNASNRKTHTLSMWIKRCELGADNSLLRANGSGDTGRTDIWFDNNDKLNVAGSSTYFRITNRRFRDVSSWYHIVFAFDTTDGTADNRLKIYVNGVQETSFATNNAYSQNTDYGINGNVAHQIGTGYAHFDGYIAEVNFVDGTQYDASFFGETKNGVWIPKAPSVTYGTNGFRLQFNQTGTGTASSSTIGADTSGNNNHFTSSGIVASDCNMPDSPENNFATFCPLSSEVSGTFSEGNLKYYSNNDSGNLNFSFSSGKYYAEVYISGGSNAYVGVIDVTQGLNPNRGGSFVNNGGIFYKQNGDQYSRPINASAATASYGASYTTSAQIIGISVDVDADTVTFYKNGVSQGTTTNGVSYVNPNGLYTFMIYGTSINFIINLGQDSSFSGNKTSQGNTDANGIGDFYYAPPSGYLALCSANLSEPTIGPDSATQADDHFNTVLYTGNGSTQSITGVGLKPDWVWTKGRSYVSNHALYDSSRGVSKRLISASTSSELDTSGVTSFDSDGFSVGSHSDSNYNSNTLVAWNWKANGGTTSSNTDGSITSTVQANTDAGFSIVLYTGTGASNATIGHGLGAVPKQIWVKNRDAAYNWKVYHAENTSAPETDYLVLDTTDATADSNTHWNDTAPTSTVFTIGSSNGLIRNNDKYVAYCFTDIEGYSKFGSFIGNGSTDGTFVYTGFRPQFVIAKCSSHSSAWHIVDADIDTNPVGYLNANTTDTYQDYNHYDLLSNGFKIRDNGTESNRSGGTFIYMAFAEAPFKYANAR